MSKRVFEDTTGDTILKLKNSLVTPNQVSQLCHTKRAVVPFIEPLLARSAYRSTVGYQVMSGGLPISQMYLCASSTRTQGSPLISPTDLCSVHIHSFN
ncbi:hypothetical protein J6590_089209 [Homalodisca vitripennis]|nr:hypothetical protein J6590_089209 [Homalodisca vitripennis]